MPASDLPVRLFDWHSSPEYQHKSLDISGDKFLEVTDVLLENPNLNSTHLFRADILSDSAHILKTNAEKENRCGQRDTQASGVVVHDRQDEDPLAAPNIVHATLERSVLRRLIPRNQLLDKALFQTCHIYQIRTGGYVVLYIPHVTDEGEMPWYHPPVKALAYIFEYGPVELVQPDRLATLSLRYLPFGHVESPIPVRLHRTFLSLLSTFVRLAKSSTSSINGSVSVSGSPVESRSLQPSALKDTIIPQHTVQDTYARLKQKYASDLIGRWVEKTEPSKHVFEDIMIAAFLIELWKQMYHPHLFPGFVDIACGNGVLVYILIKEGYSGFGLDARRRKTWDVLDIEDSLEERIIIPKPFLEALDLTPDTALPGTQIHDGIFHPNTFIISNHADELTPWTPILAGLSSPIKPLSFLAIPCCSHALSGAKHRYSPQQSPPTMKVNGAEEQSANGDLKALRAQKAKAAGSRGDEKSMYACLTKKVVVIAEEAGFDDVDLTLMRIPSTRNIGVVGNRRTRTTRVQQHGEKLNFLSEDDTTTTTMTRTTATEKIQCLIKRECSISGGVDESARAWIERAQKLQVGKGRGKVNLGCKPGR